MKTVMLLIFSLFSIYSYSQDNFDRVKYESSQQSKIKADSLTALKEFDKAIIEYDKALEYNNDEGIFLNRTITFYFMKNYDRALQDFTLLINRNGVFAKDAYFMRGMTKKAMGINPKETGCEDIYKAIELGYKVEEGLLENLCQN